MNVAMFIILMETASLVLLVAFIVYVVAEVRLGRDRYKALSDLLNLIKEGTTELRDTLVEIKRASKHFKQDVDLATTEAKGKLDQVVGKAESVAQRVVITGEMKGKDKP